MAHMTTPLVALATCISSLLVLQACGGASTAEPKSPDPNPPAATAHAAPSATTPTTMATPSSTDAPEISRSVGVDGGVVVLWPRIPGSAKDPDARQVAAKIEVRLAGIGARALPRPRMDAPPGPGRLRRPVGVAAISRGAV